MKPDLGKHFCENCDLPGEHSKKVCFEELLRKHRLADSMFDRATELLVYLGDPVKIKDEALRDKVVALDVETWRFAV